MGGLRNSQFEPDKEREVTDHKLSGTLLYQIDRSTGSLQIMYFLSQFGPSSKSKLRKNLLISQDAIENSLITLISNELIICTECTDFPFSKLVQLSKKGEILVSVPFVDWPHIPWKNKN